MPLGNRRGSYTPGSQSLTWGFRRDAPPGLNTPSFRRLDLQRAAHLGVPVLQRPELLRGPLRRLLDLDRPRRHQRGNVGDVELLQQAEAEQLRRLLDGAVLLDDLLEAAERIDQLDILDVLRS